MNNEHKFFSSGLEVRAVELRLPDNAGKSAAIQFTMIGHGNSDRCLRMALLHNNMAAALAYPNKSISGKNRADFATRKDSQLLMANA
jgi:hypothetical protein